MLAVEQRLAARCHDRFHQLLDAGKIFLRRDAERHVHMEVPGLAHEADRIRVGGKERLEPGIVGDRAARPLGHAEGGDLGVEGARLGEQLRVGRVRAGIAGLDIVEAERIELLGDEPFVLEREVDAMGLGAVP